jgi:hypothetical protein
MAVGNWSSDRPVCSLICSWRGGRIEQRRGLFGPAGLGAVGAGDDVFSGAPEPVQLDSARFRTALALDVQENTLTFNPGIGPRAQRVNGKSHPLAEVANFKQVEA